MAPARTANDPGYRLALVGVGNPELSAGGSPTHLAFLGLRGTRQRRSPTLGSLLVCVLCERLLTRRQTPGLDELRSSASPAAVLLHSPTGASVTRPATPAAPRRPTRACAERRGTRLLRPERRLFEWPSPGHWHRREPRRERLRQPMRIPRGHAAYAPRACFGDLLALYALDCRGGHRDGMGTSGRLRGSILCWPACGAVKGVFGASQCSRVPAGSTWYRGLGSIGRLT